ncbi:flagellar biosynthesis anti-sigma factor FlgM [Helicobacter sp. 13S00477-4]|uniref:flagellar biosynthesis anti-sigma factor FlgM n=1 Tax=Helicobacter sp. 13S00477-4 TaxID=1905759 RepID=UPI000BA5D3F8|nr:flagellar biosynthesis anti-sigma factor FlgM [Helicobacter sp. 13S00477-4]PAF52810.1 hypothetical protein BKH44_01100 [Helicobacter sp. 13S00477-4]
MIKSIGTPTPTLLANENKKFFDNMKAQETKEISEKTDTIKESIKKDNYKIDLQKTSEKMALNLLNL